MGGTEVSAVTEGIVKEEGGGFDVTIVQPGAIPEGVEGTGEASVWYPVGRRFCRMVTRRGRRVRWVQVWRGQA